MFILKRTHDRIVRERVRLAEALHEAASNVSRRYRDECDAVKASLDNTLDQLATEHAKRLQFERRSEVALRDMRIAEEALKDALIELTALRAEKERRLAPLRRANEARKAKAAKMAEVG